MKSNMQTIEQEEEDVSLNKKRGRDTIGEDDSPIKKEGKKKTKNQIQKEKKRNLQKNQMKLNKLFLQKKWKHVI